MLLEDSSLPPLARNPFRRSSNLNKQDGRLAKSGCAGILFVPVHAYDGVRVGRVSVRAVIFSSLKAGATDETNYPIRRWYIVLTWPIVEGALFARKLKFSPSHVRDLVIQVSHAY